MKCNIRRPPIDALLMILIRIPGSYNFPNPEIFTGLPSFLNFRQSYSVASSFRLVVTNPVFL